MLGHHHFKHPVPNELPEPCITSLPQPPIGYEPDEVTEGTPHIISDIIIIIIIAWGCPQPRCPRCHLPPSCATPSTGLPSGSSQFCSQGTHQAQHLSAHPSRSSPAGPGGVSRATGDRRDFSPKTLLSLCLSTSLLLKSCTSPTKSRARRE